MAKKGKGKAGIVAGVAETLLGSERLTKQIAGGAEVLGLQDVGAREFYDIEYVAKLAKELEQIELDPTRTIGDWNVSWRDMADPEKAQDFLIHLSRRYAARSDKQARKLETKTYGLFGDNYTKKVLSDDAVKELSVATGMSISRILKLKPGAIMNAENVQASLDILNGLQQAMIKSIKAAGVPGSGDTALVEANEMILIYSALQSQFMGVRSEIGRAQRMLQTVAQSRELDDKFVSALDGLGGPGMAEKRVEVMLDIIENRPEAIARTANDMKHATGTEMLMAIFYNNVLGGFSTDVVNTAANMYVAVAAQVENYAGAGAGAVRRFNSKGKGEDALDGMTFARANKEMIGLISSFTDALRVGGNRFFTGKRMSMNQKVQSGETTEKMFTIKNIANSIPGVNKTINIDEIPENNLTMVIDTIMDAGMGFSSRLLATEDEILRFMNYRSRLAGEVYDLVKRENLEPGSAKFNKRYNEIFEDPFNQAPALRLKAMQVANERVMTGEPGKFIKKFQDVLGTFHKSSIPGVSILSQIVFPFLKTMAQVAEYGLSRTAPVSFLMAASPNTKIGKLLRSNNPVDRDIAMGQLLVGSLMTLEATSLALGNGHMFTGSDDNSMGGIRIIGGPSGRINPERDESGEIKRIRKTQGDLEYGIFIPVGHYLNDTDKDLTVGLNRADPLGYYLSTGAALAKAIESYSNQTDMDGPSNYIPKMDTMALVLNGSMAMAEKVTESNWMGQMSELTTIFGGGRGNLSGEDKVQKGMEWMGKNFINFIPVLGHKGIQDVGKMLDPIQRNLRPAKSELTLDTETNEIVYKETDFLVQFFEGLNNQIIGSIPGKSSQFPPVPNYWDEVPYRVRRAPGGQMFGIGTYEERDYNLKDLVGSGAFSAEDLNNTWPVLNGLSFTDDEVGKGKFDNFIKVAGVKGEFERLSFWPGNPKTNISAFQTTVELNAQQQYNYSQMVKGILPESAQQVNWPFIKDGKPVTITSFMKERMTVGPHDAGYFRLSDYSSDPQVKNTKQKKLKEYYNEFLNENVTPMFLQAYPSVMAAIVAKKKQTDVNNMDAIGVTLE